MNRLNSRSRTKSCYILDLGISFPGLRSRMFNVLRKEIKMFFFNSEGKLRQYLKKKIGDSIKLGSLFPVALDPTDKAYLLGLGVGLVVVGMGVVVVGSGVVGAWVGAAVVGSGVGFGVCFAFG